MVKCLVTKLKASTGNEALSKYNVLTIKTKAVESPTLGTQLIGFGPYNVSGNDISVNSSNVGLYKSDISGELEPYPFKLYGYTERHFENKDGIIEITGKYNLGSLIVGPSGTVRMKEIYGIPMLKGKVVINNIEEEVFDSTKFLSILDKGNITVLTIPSSSKVEYINKAPSSNIGLFTKLESPSIYFSYLFDNPSVDDIANCVSLKNFNCYGFKSGKLSSFAKLKNLTQLAFSNSTQLTGDIMDFINPWIAAGRTSGKINVQWLLGQRSITLNGSPITYPSGVNDASAYLNWTSGGTVTFTAS